MRGATQRQIAAQIDIPDSRRHPCRGVAIRIVRRPGTGIRRDRDRRRRFGNAVINRTGYVCIVPCQLMEGPDVTIIYPSIRVCRQVECQVTRQVDTSDPGCRSCCGVCRRIIRCRVRRNRDRGGCLTNRVDDCPAGVLVVP